jgi:hypothetical protein
MKWNEAEASVGRVLAVEVLRLLAAEGVHSSQVKEILDSSEVGLFTGGHVFGYDNDDIHFSDFFMR